MQEIKLLLSTFERYKEKPSWELLQAMFRLTLRIGYEAGRKSVLNSRELNKYESEENEVW